VVGGADERWREADRLRRELMLVEALSKDHGIYRKADDMKVVWVMITADP
jgi:hypothetical protein